MMYRLRETLFLCGGSGIGVQKDGAALLGAIKIEIC